jgi:hypothetical protein
MRHAISRVLVTLILPVFVMFHAAYALAATGPEGGPGSIAVLWYNLRELKLVPEPATAMLVALAVGILILFRRLLLPRRGKVSRHR